MKGLRRYISRASSSWRSDGKVTPSGTPDSFTISAPVPSTATSGCSTMKATWRASRIVSLSSSACILPISSCFDRDQTRLRDAPRPRRSEFRIATTRGSRRASAFTTSQVPSVDASSTTRSSHALYVWWMMLSTARSTDPTEFRTGIIRVTGAGFRDLEVTGLHVRQVLGVADASHPEVDDAAVDDLDLLGSPDRAGAPSGSECPDRNASLPQELDDVGPKAVGTPDEAYGNVLRDLRRMKGGGVEALGHVEGTGALDEVPLARHPR